MNNITYAVSVDVNNPIIPYNVYVASVLDSNVRYLEITLYENGNIITLSNTATATASLVTDGVLVDDSVECTISNNIITVPLEGLQRNGNLDVQVTVTEGTKVLAIPFPIQVRVTPNIAENAQIDENSLGSYAEVVHEIAEARDTHTTLHDAITAKLDDADGSVKENNIADESITVEKVANDLAAVINAKEEKSNKKTTLTGNESSNDFYPTTKAVADALSTKAVKYADFSNLDDCLDNSTIYHGTLGGHTVNVFCVSSSSNRSQYVFRGDNQSATILSRHSHYSSTTSSWGEWSELAPIGNTNGRVDFSCWENKTAVCVGDSITAGSGTTQIYYNILKDMLNLASVQGMGVAGSCVSTKSNYGISNSPLINRYQNIPNKDLITIFMGTNDYGHNTPMGTIADTTDVSFYGALNVIIPGILTAHPNSRLVWITPTHRDGFGSGFTHDWIANGAGNTLQDYVNAIKDVCSRYSVPVIDLFGISGMNPVISGIKSTYMPDGLHPNALGHNKMAGYIAKFLNLYSPDLPTTTDVTVDITGITLNKNSSTIAVGETETLTAIIAPADATNKNVSWSIVSGNQYVSIVPNGSSCSVTGIGNGQSVVRVTTQDGSFTSDCTITSTTSTIDVTGVEVTGLDHMGYGSNLTLTANIAPNNATNKNVTWTITSGSEYVSLTSEGLNCLVDGIGVGSADITVTTKDGNYSDTITITIEGDIWELDYGNKYSNQSAQQTNHARLTPKAANYYFNAGNTITLIDNVNYKWQMCMMDSVTDFQTVGGAERDKSWQIPVQPGEIVNGWTSTQSWTVSTSGYYALALLKSNNADFDLTIDSDNAFDYISVS